MQRAILGGWSTAEYIIKGRDTMETSTVFPLLHSHDYGQRDGFFSFVTPLQCLFNLAWCINGTVVEGRTEGHTLMRKVDA